MKQLLILLSLLMAVQTSAQERQMLSAIDAHLRMQGVMLNERAPEARTDIPAQDLFVQTSATQPERQMLSAFDAHTRMQGLMLSESVAVPDQAQVQLSPWPNYQLVRYVTAYSLPVYYVAPYPQPYTQSVAEWLWGTPRTKPIPVEVAEPEPVQIAAVVAPQPKPRATPTPVPAPPAPEAAPPDAAQIEAAHAAQQAAEQMAAEQQLARLALETRIARQDALRWMGMTIVFGLFTGGVCLYTLRHTRPKED